MSEEHPHKEHPETEGQESSEPDSGAEAGEQTLTNLKASLIKKKKPFNPRFAKTLFSVKNLNWITSGREFSGLTLDLKAGEKYAIVGWDSQAKNALLSVFPQIDKIHDGTVQIAKGLRIATMKRSLTKVQKSMSIREYFLSIKPELSLLINEYKNTLQSIKSYMNEFGQLSEEGKKKKSEITDKISSTEAGKFNSMIEKALKLLAIPGETKLNTLSVGIQKRVLYLGATIQRPHLLIMQNPLQGGDLNSKIWIENRVIEFPGAIIFISNDRMFIKNCEPHKFMEIDDKFNTYQGPIDRFMSLSTGSILGAGSDENTTENSLNKEAEKPKNISTLKQKAVRAFNSNKGPVYRKNLSIADGLKEPLLRVKELSVRLGEKGQSDRLLNGVNFELYPGEKIGIFGPSGSGRTSLLRTLADQSQPVGGNLILKEGIKVDVLDPSRIIFNPDKNPIKQFTDQEHMMIGKTYTPVAAYLEEFGMNPACFETPYKLLRESEKFYLALSVLMMDPPDIWIMDNWFDGFDLETLILVEDFMINFEGGIIFSTDDRWILEKLSKRAVCLSPLPHGAVEARTKDENSAKYYDFTDLGIGDKFPHRDALHFVETVVFGAQQRQDVDELMLVNRLKKLKSEYNEVSAKIKSGDSGESAVELSRRFHQLEKQVSDTEKKLIEQKKKLSI